MEGMLREFRDFLLRGNIVELAIAFVMGIAFATVVNSLVNDLGPDRVGRWTAGSTAGASATRARRG
jgi:large conductance mechanosensitive channel